MDPYGNNTFRFFSFAGSVGVTKVVPLLSMLRAIDLGFV